MTQQFYQIVMGGKRPAEADFYKPAVQLSWLDALQFANELSRLAGLQPAYRIRRLGHSGQNTERYEVSWRHGADGYRLPTEAEWEYAAQGGAVGRRFVYSGSNSAEDVGWYADNSGRLRIVGQKEPNEIGLYDMSGNVWDWLWDRFGPLEALRDSAPQILGPDDLSVSGKQRVSVWRGPGAPLHLIGRQGQMRVCRGGGWNAPRAAAQVLQRRACDETARYYAAVGFRLAQTVPQ